MNTADGIALAGMRAMAKGGASFLEDMAEDLAEDVDKDRACGVRLDAIARARAAAKAMREASTEMRRLNNALEALDEGTDA